VVHTAAVRTPVVVRIQAVVQIVVDILVGLDILEGANPEAADSPLVSSKKRSALHQKRTNLI
jgi:hypothetical protein